MRVSVNRRFSERRIGVVVVCTAILVGLLAARSMFVKGTIGYVDDWNVPASPQGLWIWGLSDLSPWLPLEYGLPLAYPTDVYLKLVLGIFGLIGISPQLVIALFLSASIAAGFVGCAFLTRELWDASLTRQLCAGLVYATSPVLFDALVPGYLTFVLAYAALPWLAVCLVRALRGKKSAWFAYAFFVALTLPQVQFVIFDAALTATIVIAIGVFRDYCLAALFLLMGCVLPYLFIVVNVLGSPNIVGLSTTWSAHSWTSLSAPGIVKAIMLVPSVYPYLDLLLGPWHVVWRVFGAVLVLGALIVGFRSQLRIARAFAVLLVIALVFLHGPNPPITAIMTWLLDLKLLVILRNINYVFALVALLVPVLLTAPRKVDAAPQSATHLSFGLHLNFTIHRQSRPSRGLAFKVAPDLRFNAYNVGLAVLCIMWSLPWMVNKYTVIISPIPGRNDTKPIIGAASRTLVFPHLQVVDRRRLSRGGVNPNSVETITPVYVRDTATGPLEASILDRLTDWQPDARTLGATLRTAHVNAIALQSSLDSTFPRFVNSYLDDWLLDAYKTKSFQQRLNEADSVVPRADGTTIFYEAQAPHQTDLQTGNVAMAVTGGAENEIAMRGIGINDAFVPAEQIDNARSNWVGGLVQGLGSPEVVPSRADVQSGAYLPAGIVTDHRTADFHTDWADIMDSVNWWYSAALLQQPRAAITDGRGLAFTIPVPAGSRHIWLQVYDSAQGGLLRFQGAVATRWIHTSHPTTGSYRWIDLGWSDGAKDLRITSIRGFNAVGDVLMLTAAEVAADHRRFEEFGRKWYAQVRPNGLLDGETQIDVTNPRWHPDIVLANPSHLSIASIQAAVTRTRGVCRVLVGDVRFVDVTTSLDGHAPDGKGSLYKLTDVPCAAKDEVSLQGVRLSSTPRSIHNPAWQPDVTVRSGAVRTTTKPALNMLSLPFHPLSFGHHVLRMSYPSLFARPRWGEVKNAITQRPVPPSVGSSKTVSFDRTPWIKITTSKLVYRRMELRPPKPGDNFLLVGSYLAPMNSRIRITLIQPGKVDELISDLWGDGKLHYYHIDLSPATRNPGDGLYIYFYPPAKLRGMATARVSVSLIQGMAADVILTAHEPSVPSERQLQPASLGQNRYRISETGRVIQYDQTYDSAWQLSVPAGHYSSASGFNVWIRRDRGGDATIAYRTGVAYAVALVFSMAAFCILGVMGMGFIWRLGETRPRDLRFLEQRTR